MVNSNIKNIKENTVSELVRNGISASEAKIEAEILFEHITGLNKLEQLLKPDYELGNEEFDLLEQLVNKRIKERIPVQYLTNKAYFMGYEFYVDENVLIPRPETELLVEEVIKIASSMLCIFLEKLELLPELDDIKLKIADIGTGSGCIAISLAKTLANAEVFATDISEKSIEVAKINSKKLEAENKITFKEANILEGIDETFDIIVSNPPYIPNKDRYTLDAEVLLHEPHRALFADDEDGIDFYDRIIKQACDKLKPNGYIAFEIGINQAVKISNLLENSGFKNINIIKDYAGIKRIITAKK